MLEYSTNSTKPKSAYSPWSRRLTSRWVSRSDEDNCLEKRTRCCVFTAKCNTPKTKESIMFNICDNGNDLAFMFCSFSSGDFVNGDHGTFPANLDLHHTFALLFLTALHLHPGNHPDLALAFPGLEYHLVGGSLSLSGLQLDSSSIRCLLVASESAKEQAIYLQSASLERQDDTPYTRSNNLSSNRKVGSARCPEHLSRSKSQILVPYFTSTNVQPDVTYLAPILFDALRILRAYIKSVPVDQRPSQPGRNKFCGWPSSTGNAVSSTPTRNSANPPNPGQGAGLQVSVQSWRGSSFQSNLGCFVGKVEIDLPECAHARRHWELCRSLCRSKHLEWHVEKGHLTLPQLLHLRWLANRLTNRSEVEAWKDCFLYLYPEFQALRGYLNPHVGEPLLDNVADPRRYLQQPQGGVPVRFVPPTRHTQSRPTNPIANGRLPQATTPLSTPNTSGPAVRRTPTNLPRSERLVHTSTSEASQAYSGTWAQVASWPNLHGASNPVRQGYQTPAAPSVQHETVPHQAQTDSDIPIDPELEFPDRANRVFTTNVPPVSWREPMPTISSSSITTPSMTEGQTTANDDGGTLTPIPSHGGFPMQRDLVHTLGADSEIDRPSDTAFSAEIEQITITERGESSRRGNNSTDPPYKYINPRDMHINSPGDTGSS